MASNTHLLMLRNIVIATFLTAIYISHGNSLNTTSVQCYKQEAITLWIPHEEEYTTLSNVTTCDSVCSHQCQCTLTKNSIINDNCSDKNVVEVNFIDFSSDTGTLFLANYSLDNIDQFAFIHFGDTLTDLYLNNNSLSIIQPGVFDGLVKLQSLHLYRNKLSVVLDGAFAGLVSLEKLDIVSNVIQHLQPHAFAGLHQLRVLDLGDNELTILNEELFTDLKLLENLNLEENKLMTIKPNAFTGLSMLQKLDIDFNKLTNLYEGIFDGLVLVEEIDLDYNELIYVPSNSFRGLSNLLELDLDHNAITELTSDIFGDLINLEELELDDNALTILPLGLFNYLINVKRLSISQNMVLELHLRTFDSMRSLVELHLSYNNLSELHESIFKKNSNLEILFLDHNDFSSVDRNLFSNLKSLEALSLAVNEIASLEFDVFKDARNLRFLNLSRNHLQSLPSEIFYNFLLPETLDLTQNPLQWINREPFDRFIFPTTIYVDNYATCCFIQSARCSFESPPSSFLSCKRLLPYSILRIVIWITGFATLFGNIFALFSRFKERRDRNIQFLLITNLSISDFLMGIYMLILLSVDLYYEEFFPSHSESWRHSILCRSAGALSLLSSEASVFFITLISLDRYIGVKFPFHAIRLRKSSAKLIVCVMWFTAICLSIASIIIPTVNDRLYDVSEICVGLPISRSNTYVLETKSFDLNTSSFEVGLDIGRAVEAKFIESKSSMYFSIAIFTGLNLVCFILVAYCYLSIFITAKKTSLSAGRNRNVNDELRMAFKMAGIVFTDFCCWMLVVVLSILVQSGIVTIKPVAYAWIATFVLPINACLNPFLYTLASLISDRFQSEKKAKKRSSTTSMNQTSKTSPVAVIL